MKHPLKTSEKDHTNGKRDNTDTVWSYRMQQKRGRRVTGRRARMDIVCHEASLPSGDAMSDRNNPNNLKAKHQNGSRAGFIVFTL